MVSRCSIRRVRLRTLDTCRSCSRNTGHRPSSTPILRSLPLRLMRGIVVFVFRNCDVAASDQTGFPVESCCTPFHRTRTPGDPLQFTVTPVPLPIDRLRVTLTAHVFTAIYEFELAMPQILGGTG